MYMIFQYNLKIWEFTMFHDLITRLTSKIKAIIMQPRIDSNFVSGAKRGRICVQKGELCFERAGRYQFKHPSRKKNLLQMVDSLSPSLSF